MAITQDKRVNRMGANAAHDSEKFNVVNRSLRASGANAPAAQPAWLRPIASYERKEPKAFAVTRFG